MAGKDLTLTIGIVDRASGAFKAIAANVSAVTKQIESAADGASTALKKQESATDSLTDASKRYEEAGRKIGLGLAGLGGAFTAYSRGLVDNQRQLSTLERNYGTAAEGIRKFADELQRSTTFSSEAAVASANVFSTLAKQYGFTADEIQQLITVSSDLAAATGFGLEDVSERVAAAMRGETEAAEALGLTLNQNSIDREGVTLSMTNQEAAHFRLNALLQQSTFAEGAAAEQASTTAGRVKQLANGFSDLGRDIAAASGPIAPVVAGLTEFGLANGAAVAGLISLAKGVREYVAASGGMKAATTGLLGAIGPNGLLIAGLGIAAIAAYKLYDAFNDDLPNAFEIAGDQIDDVDTALKTLITTMDDVTLAFDLSEGQKRFNSILDDVIAGYTAAHDLATKPQDLQYTAIGEGDVPAQIKEQNAAIQESIDLNNEVTETFGSATAASELYAQAQSALIQIYSDTTAGAAGAQQSIANLFAIYEASKKTPEDLKALLDGIILTAADLPNYTTVALAAAASSEKLAEAISHVSATMNNELKVAIAELIGDGAPQQYIDQWLAILPELQFIMDRIAETVNPDASDQTEANIGKIMLSGNVEAIETLKRLLFEADQGYLDPGTLVMLIDQLANDQLPTLQAEAKILANTLGQDLNPNLGETAKVGGDTATVLGTVASRTAEANAEAAKYEKRIYAANEAGRAAVKLAAEEAHEIDGKTEALRDLAFASTAAEIREEKERRTAESNRQAREKQKQALRDYLAAAKETAEQIGLISTDAQKFQIAGVDTPALNVAVNLQVSQSSLEDVNRVIVGNTNQLSQQLGGIKSWADELIGDPGVWKEIDNLFNDGLLGDKDTKGLEVYNAAQEAQISISQDVTRAQRDLLAVQVMLAPVIADMVKQQADYIESLRGMDQQSQLAALGYMDQAESSKAMQLAQLAAMSTTDEMRDSTEQMIQKMAASDPVLKAMLEDMGLLNEQDGTVNFDSNAVDVGSAIEELTKSIDALIKLLGGVPPLHVDSSEFGTAREAVDELTIALGGIPPDVTFTVNAIDGYSWVLDDAKRALDNLDGSTATVYVRSQNWGLESDPTFGGRQDGGSIYAFSNGGSLFDAPFIDVPHYMTGGSHAIVGERGPELVWLPNGSQVTNTEGTRSRLQQEAKRGRRSGDLINRGTIIVQPASSDIEPAVRRKMLAGWRK